jgi:ABC-2 type transport system ATP-binding protein
MTVPAFETDRLTRRFGSFTAVDAVSLRAFDGEVLALLGPNGAGKTTLLKMILGLLRPTSGRVIFRGKDVRGPRPAVGYMSQRFGLYPLLTGLENIAFAAGASGLSRTAVRATLERARSRVPADVLNRKVKDIPAGRRQQVALHACLAADPEIVILDEPTSGAGPLLRRDFRAEIAALRSAGRAILLTTHELEDVEIADRIVILDRGRIVLSARPDELSAADASRTPADVYLEALEHVPRI